MAIIKTKQNSVHVEQPEADDVVIEVSFVVPDNDGKHSRPRGLGWFPVSDFQECVDWAIGMADKMARPIYILPLSHNDIFRTERFEPYRRLLANLTERERCEMREFLIGNCAELMRDCNDPAIRTNVYDTLVQLKAFRPIPTRR